MQAHPAARDVEYTYLYDWSRSQPEYFDRRRLVRLEPMLSALLHVSPSARTPKSLEPSRRNSSASFVIVRKHHGTRLARRQGSGRHPGAFVNSSTRAGPGRWLSPWGELFRL